MSRSTALALSVLVAAGVVGMAVEVEMLGTAEGARAQHVSDGVTASRAAWVDRPHPALRRLAKQPLLLPVDRRPSEALAPSPSPRVVPAPERASSVHTKATRTFVEPEPQAAEDEGERSEAPEGPVEEQDAVTDQADDELEEDDLELEDESAGESGGAPEAEESDD